MVAFNVATGDESLGWSKLSPGAPDEVQAHVGPDQVVPLPPVGGVAEASRADFASWPTATGLGDGVPAVAATVWASACPETMKNTHHVRTLVMENRWIARCIFHTPLKKLEDSSFATPFLRE